MSDVALEQYRLHELGELHFGYLHGARTTLCHSSSSSGSGQCSFHWMRTRTGSVSLSA